MKAGLLKTGAALCAVALTAAACSSGQPGTRSAHVAAGVADVAYAGSLEYVNERVVGPAFTRATGVRYLGRAGGSFGLAHDIQAGEITPNVFMSVGSAPIAELEPAATRWYVQLLASPLVVAYTRSGPYAAQLGAIAAGRRPLKSLFALLARPGFRLGRTNPDTDPQGQAFVEMVELAAQRYHLGPAAVGEILGPPTDSPEIFAETALDSQLQAGELDAASAFRSQAVQLHLPYVALPPAIDFGDPALAAEYAGAGMRLSSGVVVHGAPLTVDLTLIGHPSPAAIAFARFVLSPAGRALYARAGYELLPEMLVGPRRDVPAAVLAQLAPPAGAGG